MTDRRPEATTRLQQTIDLDAVLHKEPAPAGLLSSVSEELSVKKPRGEEQCEN
jgi:hypothetical protein